MKLSINKVVVVLLSLAAVTAVDTAVAHHSFAMFDRDREEVLSGTVVRWAFNSPHVALYIETADGVVYGFEGAAPAALIGRSPSMNGFSFQPGDAVTVVQCPLHDGRNGGALGYIVTADGTWYRPNDGGCGPSENWEQWLPAGYMSKAQAEAAM